MADVFPRRNLPGDAEQWGREVEKRVAAVDSTLESVQQSVQGQNRNIASSLSVLAEQIAAIREAQEEIIAQASYSNEEPSVSILLPAGSPVPYETPHYAPLYFTLQETRKVTVRNSVYLATSLYNSGSSPTDSQALFRTYYLITNRTTGQIWTQGRTTQYGAQASTGTFTGIRFSATQTFFDDLALPPGEYECVMYIQVTIVDGDGGSILIQSPRNAVQILERV